MANHADKKCLTGFYLSASIMDRNPLPSPFPCPSSVPKHISLLWEPSPLLCHEPLAGSAAYRNQRQPEGTDPRG